MLAEMQKKRCVKCWQEGRTPNASSIAEYAARKKLTQMTNDEMKRAAKKLAAGKRRAAKAASAQAVKLRAEKRSEKSRELLVRAELASRELSRRRFLHFVKRFNPKYEAGWVHEDICRRLEQFKEDVKAKKSPRLLLLMPPRHGKSELASRRYPAWHIGDCPDHEIISVSYNLSLPSGFSRSVRELLRNPEYQAIFPNTRLSEDSQSVEEWRTTAGGGMMAVGVGGGITGKGAHVLVIDDPIKNWEDADSQLTRDMVWNWYQSTAYTRLAPGGGVLVIETWWNDDDLAGRLQLAMETDPYADKFVVVKYPAIAEAGDEYLIDDRIEYVKPGHEVPEGATLIRPMGEALHPERYDIEALKRIKNTLTAQGNLRIWSSLYQQNPVPDEGAFFRRDWIKYDSVLPAVRGRYIYQAWDFAISTKQTSDWTVGITIMVDEYDAIHVIDITRFRSDDSAVIADEILNMAAKWRPLVVGFEDGQIWKSIRTTVERRARERRIYISYEPLPPLTDKQVRAQPLRGRMQLGKVWIFEAIAEQIVREMLRFPGGANDDIIDALAWAVRMTLNRAAPKAKEPKKVKGWKDRLEEFTGTPSGRSHMSA